MPGVYKFSAIIDYKNLVQETNEYDNGVIVGDGQYTNLTGKNTKQPYNTPYSVYIINPFGGNVDTFDIPFVKVLK